MRAETRARPFDPKFVRINKSDIAPVENAKGTPKSNKKRMPITRTAVMVPMVVHLHQVIEL